MREQNEKLMNDILDILAENGGEVSKSGLLAALRRSFGRGAARRPESMGRRKWTLGDTGVDFEDELRGMGFSVERAAKGSSIRISL